MKGANSPWSCGDVVKRVDLRRGFCFVAALSLAARLRSRRRHGQYNCDSNWIGKNAAAEREKGPRTTTATTTHSMRKRRKGGRSDGRERGQQHGSRSLLPSPKVWHGSQKSTSRRKKAIYLWQQQRAERNRTAAVFCWFIVGRSKEEGRGKAGRTQSKFDHDMQMTAAASIPFFPAATQKRLTPSPLSPLRLD